MTATKYLWPKPGLKLRNGDTMGFIPEDGAEVPLDNLTYRRLAAGELLDKDPRALVREAFPDTTAPAEAPALEPTQGLAPASADEPPKDDTARSGRKVRERFEKEG